MPNACVLPKMANCSSERSEYVKKHVENKKG
jgi:hypothetical protein